MNVGHTLLKLNLNLQAGLWIRIFMDMHSFSLPDPDPPSKCGYGWEIFLNKKRKNARKLVIIAILFKCFKFAQGPLFWFFTFEKSFRKIIRYFLKSFKAEFVSESGSAMRKTAGSGSSKKQCGFTALPPGGLQ